MPQNDSQNQQRDTQSQKKSSVLIIGAGFGGLSAAGLLAHNGFDVTVVEKNSHIGGRAAVHVAEGFTFDMGPSWYLFQNVFEKWFAVFGKKPSDFYQLVKLDPQYRVYFDDKTHVDIAQGKERNAALFEQIEPGAAKKLEHYLADGARKYSLSLNHFLYKNADSLLDLLMNWQLMRWLPFTSIFEPISWYIQRFFRSKKLQQILEYNLIFLGCSPKNAPSLFSMMAYVDMVLGVEYPKGGMSTVIDGMTQICKQQGVRFVCDTPVTKLETKGDSITAVHTTKKTYYPDIVLSTADYMHTEQLLSDQNKVMYKAAYWNKKTPGPSAYLLYLGIKGKIPELLHHTFYFSDAWEKHFEDIFDNPIWPKNPSIYINNPSATDPTLAPPNCSAVMVLVPIAAGLSDTPQQREHFTEQVLSTIEKKCGTSLRKKIVYQKVYSLNEFTNDYNSFKGNAFGGLANTFFQSAIWRPRNFSTKLKNLYFAGAGTAPGIGVPTAIISGHLATDRILQHTS